MSFKRFKTEKILLGSIVVLTLFLFASAFSKEMGTSISMAEEESGASSPSSNDEGSQDNEGSQEENSKDDEQSEPSVSSVPSVRTMQTAGSVEEVSEKSSDEVSQQSAEETSEVSEPSEKLQEISEESIKYVEGYGEVVSREGNVALVKKDEKLFFLIPVEVESQVTLGEQGTVVDEQKSFLNWLFSVLSF